MGHQSKHNASHSSHSSSAHKKSQGGGMLGPYIYGPGSVSEIPYQGYQMTIDQRRQGMSNQLDNFDQKFGVQVGQTRYQQSYAATRR